MKDAIIQLKQKPIKELSYAEYALIRYWDYFDTAEYRANFGDPENIVVKYWMIDQGFGGNQRGMFQDDYELYSK
jgi:hypothetical protein